MSVLADLSIRRKLALIVIIVSGAALVAGGLLLMLSLRWYRGDQRRSLEATAQLVANAGAAAVDFGDADEGQLAIRFLSADPDVLAGAFYRDGNIFASYVRTGATETLPARAPPAGFNAKELTLVKPVLNPEGHAVGAVYVKTAPEVEDRFLWRSGGILLVIILLGVLVAVPLIHRFQKIITKPILRLLWTAQEVSRNQNFSLRAGRLANDELGQLVDGFNQMLEQIETRDRQLKKHRDHLEEEVAQRTAALREVNEELRAAKDRAEHAQQAASDANQAKSRFLASMSHELRTPLNAIIGYSEMLQEEADDLGRRSFKPDLERIHGAGKHLLSLINDVLDLSKIEAGKMTLFLETFDVRKLINEVAATIQPLIQKNGNTLKMDCPADLGLMHADQIKVRQTLFNLLSNASKFTEQGVITLRVWKEEGRMQNAETSRPGSGMNAPLLHPSFDLLHFQVADTGIGLTPEQLSRLFQVFTQAEAATSRKYGGTGLGLVLSRGFCQLMGGDIAVTSEPGQGSTFTVTLPVEVRESAPAAAEACTDSSVDPLTKAAATGPTVQRIDEGPIARDLLQRVDEGGL